MDPVNGVFGDGDDIALTSDGRGFEDRIENGSVDVGAFEFGAEAAVVTDDPSLIVTTLDDVVDDTDGETSLREAIGFVNDGTFAAGSTITFASGVGEAFENGGEIDLNDASLTPMGELEINASLTIDGDVNDDGVADVTVNAQSASRVFTIDLGPPVDVTIEGLTLTGGSVSGSGGAVYLNGDHTLNLVNSVVETNTASDAGGGIFVATKAELTLTNTVVSNNDASSLSGGGVYNAGTATLVNVTVSGNSASSAGGGIFNNGSASLNNTIVLGNAGGSGEDEVEGTYDGTASIIGTSLAISSGSVGVIGGTVEELLNAVFADVAVNDLGVLSGVLADNGGPVETVALNPDAANPAIDAATADVAFGFTLDETVLGVDIDGDSLISNTAIDSSGDILTDARGFDRDVDFVPPAGTPDLGAFEQQNGATFTVTTLVDENDAADTSFATFDAAAPAGTGLSLREAIALANEDPTTADTILFAGDALADPGLVLLDAAGEDVTSGTIFLGVLGELDISASVTIDGDLDGDGTADITLSALDSDDPTDADSADSRVLNIDSGGDNATVALEGLVITDGSVLGLGGGIQAGNVDLTILNSTVSDNTAYSDGGGIIVNGGSLTVINTAVVGNFAGSSLSGSVEGGGIASFASDVTVTGSTVSGNTAFSDGGGIFVSGGSLTITDATISGNSANDDGGGINVSSSPATLINTTVADNSAENGGGLYSTSGAQTLINATVTGNVATDGGGVLTTGGAVSIVNGIVTGNAAATNADTGVALGGGGSITANASIIGASGYGIGPGGGSIFYGGDVDAVVDAVFADTVTVDPDGTPGNGDEVLAGALADNGGAVETIALNPLGLAIDAGDNALAVDPGPDGVIGGGDDVTLTTDARGAGFDRLFDGDGDATATVDIGAFEVQTTLTPLVGPQTFIVTTLTDEALTQPTGFGLTQELLDAATADGDGLSLREAIALANLDATTADTIVFAGDAVFDALGTDLTGVIQLDSGSGELVITAAVTIDGDVDDDGTADITSQVTSMATMRFRPTMRPRRLTKAF